MPEPIDPSLSRIHLGDEILRANLHQFSAGKDPENPEANEDLFASSDTSFVLADGSTAKEGTKDVAAIYGKSGGQVAAEIAVRATQESELNGVNLVRHVTKQLNEEYRRNYPAALEDSRRRFAVTLLAARIVGNELVITQVGDSGFRINGRDVFVPSMLIDMLDAQARATAIHQALNLGLDEPAAAKFGREYIEPSLNQQYSYRNNPHHLLGFGCIDGGEVPEKFIKTGSFQLRDVSTLEMFSDGYPVHPPAATVEAWEAAYEQAQAEDPLRYKKHLATKPADDRTVAILEFSPST
jgi:hypothetical protein